MAESLSGKQRFKFGRKKSKTKIGIKRKLKDKIKVSSSVKHRRSSQSGSFRKRIGTHRS